MAMAVRVAVRMSVIVGMSVIHRRMLYYNITEVHAVAWSQLGALAALIARVLRRFCPRGRAQATLEGGRRRPSREGAGDPKEGAVSPQEGDREDRVRAAPAVSRARCRKRRTRAYRFSGSSPAFPAQWF
jgi:hypothetical protein